MSVDMNWLTRVLNVVKNDGQRNNFNEYMEDDLDAYYGHCNQANNENAQMEEQPRAFEHELLEEEEVIQEVVTTIKSVKGKDKKYQGYLFVADGRSKPDGKTQFWRCDKFSEKDGKCPARLHTLVRGNVFVKIWKSHNHAVDPVAPSIALVKTNLKRRAVETHEKPIQLFTHELQSLTSMVSFQLSKSAVRKQVRRVRIALQAPVIEANVVADVYIPEDFKYYNTDDGPELFLLADSGEHMRDPERVLIFGRQSHREWASEMDHVYMDGTFNITPSPFAQVYVILAEKIFNSLNGEKYVFPILYALLKNKSGASYSKLFSMVKTLMPDFRPKSISVDFEQVAIQALHDHFPLPGTKIDGCLFHLMRNFKKHLGAAGLMVKYRDATTNFALTSRTIIALSFGPPTLIWTAFDILQNYLLVREPSLEPVLNWFSTNYVGTVTQPPPFPVYLWSCYDRTLAKEDRTNNYAEAAHRRLHTISEVDHPTIGRFLTELKEVQKLYDFNYEKHVGGVPPVGKRRAYLQADARIMDLVDSFGQKGLIEYLRGLAHNFIMDQ